MRKVRSHWDVRENPVYNSYTQKNDTHFTHSVNTGESGVKVLVS